jgi:hypothetical protein
MKYIFNTLEEAQGYEKSVSELHNYKNGTYWDDVTKHPIKSLWAVEASNKLILEDQEPRELTSDWYEAVPPLNEL